MTNDATNAIAAAPTTRSPNAGVGIGPLVSTAALAGTCWDSTALSLLCGDLISYSFGRRQRNLLHGHSMRLCSRNQHRGSPQSTHERFDRGQCLLNMRSRCSPATLACSNTPEPPPPWPCLSPSPTSAVHINDRGHDA